MSNPRPHRQNYASQVRYLVTVELYSQYEQATLLQRFSMVRVGADSTGTLVAHHLNAAEWSGLRCQITIVEKPPEDRTTDPITAV